MPTTLKIPKHIWSAISVLLLEDAMRLDTVEPDWLMEGQLISDD
jgi:hypothetical protein